MNFRREPVTFFTFLIIGLNIAYCLIEQTKYDPEKMKFEMEIFNRFEALLNKCHKIYRKNELEYDSKFWSPIKEKLTSAYPRKLKFSENLKMELSCIEAMYSKTMRETTQRPRTLEEFEKRSQLAIIWVVQFLAVEYSSVFLQGYYYHEEKENTKIAGHCLHIAAYLGAFGADPYTSLKFFEVIKETLFVSEFKRSTPNSGVMGINVKSLQYPILVDFIRIMFFSSNYTPEENKMQIIMPSFALRITFERINLFSLTIKSNLLTTIFAEVDNGVPGLRSAEIYQNENLWNSALETGRELFESIESIITRISPASSSSNQDESSRRSSALIQFLRELEKLKIRIHNSEMPPNKMKEIERGFHDEGKLVVKYVRAAHVPNYIIFTKLINYECVSETAENLLANGRKLGTTPSVTHSPTPGLVIN